MRDMQLLGIKEKKQQFGQFFTTNSDYILQGLEKYVRNKDITDPFVGGGDLLDWAKRNGAATIKGYDIDSKCVDNKTIFWNDSLLNPKSYDFVLTNPPYLNVNKGKDEIKKKYFRKTGLEDLYQISLRAIKGSEEGIAIVPINFLSAQNSEKIRREFFAKFEIIEMNYFKQRVFSDTTYNVIAFYYRKRKDLLKPESVFVIKTNIFPDNKKIDIELSQRLGWLIGGDFVSKIDEQDNRLKIRRLTEEDMIENRGNIEIEAAYNHTDTKRSWKISEEFCEKINSNIILLKAIDSGSESGKIALEDIRDYGVGCLVSKSTSRHMIYLIFENNISVFAQKKLIRLFNERMEYLRHKYMSLFLTNYRDKDRKRISFDFAYKLLNHLYFTEISKNKSNTLF